MNNSALLLQQLATRV